MQQAIWTITTQSDFLRQRTVKVKQMTHAVSVVARDLVDTWDTVAAHGIAAPQIGSGWRIFIWKGGEMSDTEIIVNPKIIKARGELADFDGCLSVPGVYGVTRRAAEIEITGWDRQGAPIRRTYEGFDARIIQHEVDHLEGVLFIDRLDTLDGLYTLEAVWEKGSEETFQEKRPLTDPVTHFIEAMRRPIPGHALKW